MSSASFSDSSEQSTSLLVEIAWHALPRLALGSGDIVRRRLEEILTRLPLHLVRHAIECAPQTDIRIAAAAAHSTAGVALAAPPQRESVAVASLLQRLFDRQAPRVLHRVQFRFALVSPARNIADSPAASAASFIGKLSRCRGAPWRPSFAEIARRAEPDLAAMTPAVEPVFTPDRVLQAKKE
jgi:hypothetical protein